MTFVYVLEARRRLPNGYYVISMSHECSVIGSDHTLEMVGEHVYDWRVRAPYVWGYRKPAGFDEQGKLFNDFFLLDTSSDRVEIFESSAELVAALNKLGLDSSTVADLMD